MAKRGTSKRRRRAPAAKAEEAPAAEVDGAAVAAEATASGPIVDRAGFAYASGAAFLSGGCLMVMEIVASRVLAPAFGNTIFVWSSVIGLIMAALSGGYYLGGVLADRRPHLSTLAWSLVFAGLAVGVIPLLSAPLLEVVADAFAGMMGPLVMSAILFVVPGVLIGTVSPIAVKLVALGGAEVGHASGRVSALGALGSIVGTLSAGFVFVPLAGITTILVGIALVLAVLGAAGFALARAPLPRPGAVVALTLALGALATVTDAGASEGVLLDEQTFYHRVRVTDVEWTGRPARILTLDTTSEGAMFLDGDGLPFRYTRFVDVADVFLGAPRSAAFVGGGSFAMPKRFVERHEGARAVAFELDPVVVEAGRRFFGVDEVEGLEIVTGDARQNLRRSEARFDLIFGDAYNGVRAVPAHLATLEYYRMLRQHLRVGGVYMANIISPVTGPQSGFFRSTVRTLRQVFPEVYVFALGDGASGSQNLVLVAPVVARQWSTREIRDLGRQAGLEALTETILDLEDVERYSAPFSEAALLTDDHSPVENLVSDPE
jgi:spermidine synthase